MNLRSDVRYEADILLTALSKTSSTESTFRSNCDCMKARRSSVASASGPHLHCTDL